MGNPNNLKRVLTSDVYLSGMSYPRILAYPSLTLTRSHPAFSSVRQGVALGPVGRGLAPLISSVRSTGYWGLPVRNIS